LAAGALCKLNIFNLDDSISSSTAQIYKSFSLQLCETLIWLKYRSLWTKIHTPPFNQMQQSSLHCCKLAGKWLVCYCYTLPKRKKVLKKITYFFYTHNMLNSEAISCTLFTQHYNLNLLWLLFFDHMQTAIYLRWIFCWYVFLIESHLKYYRILSI
jgi:hypothetical protein